MVPANGWRAMARIMLEKDPRYTEIKNMVDHIKSTWETEAIKALFEYVDYRIKDYQKPDYPDTIPF